MQVSGGFSFSGGFTFTPPSAVVSLFNGITNYSYTTNSYAGGAGTNYQSAYSVDGTKLYYNNSGLIIQYTLSTPYNISTATNSGKSFDISGTSAYGIDFSTDGTKLYLSSRAFGSIRQYAMSTPWDISTASYTTQSLNTTITTGSFILQDLAVATDGSAIFFAVQDGTKLVYRLSLSTPWDASTATISPNSLSIASQTSAGPIALAITKDGLNVLVAAGTNTILQYSLATAWNLSTASYIGSKTFAQLSDIYSLYFGNTDTQFIASGSDGSLSYQYSNGL
jgi:hypothetical protein